MRKVILIIASIMTACSIIKPVPIETGTTVNVRDSIRWEVRDSVVIREATRYKDMAWLGDSLRIKGQRSRMWAVADTAKGAIVGGLEEDKAEEKTRIVYKDRWKVRDSLVFKEIPIEVEKPVRYTPRWVWWSLAFNILTILGIGLIIYLKIKKPIG